MAHVGIDKGDRKDLFRQEKPGINMWRLNIDLIFSVVSLLPNGPGILTVLTL